ncbi:MAG: COG2426 family protein [Vulcanibacillus sp.]
MNDILYIMFISMLPIVELRGAIPIGLGLGVPLWEVLIFSIIGNLIPIIPILVLFQPISKIFLRFKWYNKFYNWLHRRSLSKGKSKLDKYGAAGLFIFTAIPLPTTGAWTASFIASFFGIKIKYSFIAITLGVIVAGIIVTIFSNVFL